MLNKLSWQHEFDCNEGDVVSFTPEYYTNFGGRGERWIVKLIRIADKEYPEGLVLIDKVSGEPPDFPYDNYNKYIHSTPRKRLSYNDAIKYLEKIS